jgi:hypothetical protein
MCELLEFKITNFPFSFLNYLFKNIIAVVFKRLLLRNVLK